VRCGRPCNGIAGRFKERIEFWRRFDRIGPVALIDRGTLGNEPTVGMALHPVEETGRRSEIDLDAAEPLTNSDDKGSFRDRAVLIERDHQRQQVMARPSAARAKAGAATVNELLEWAAKPRHGDVSFGSESCS